MTLAIDHEKAKPGPKLKQKHHSYDESVDEPAKTIEDEPVEIEGEVPAEDNEPIERNGEDGNSEAPVFEE
jgi:hypothetical protein